MLLQNLLLFAVSFILPSDQVELQKPLTVQKLSNHGFDADDLTKTSVSPGTSSCSKACALLATRYGPGHIFHANTTAYTTFRSAYWSAIQTDVHPECVFQPPDANAVAALVLVSRLTECPFALKSGGHSAFAGAASIQAGITVSLQNLKEISLSQDKNIAHVGPGSDWGQVYSKLAEDELTVIGGRIGNVGVGGLTLGGGISFFSGSHGWACDNVEAYEIVTATGTQMTASSTQNPDLYWALRGGGNNFGIVTKFHLRTIPIPGNNIWAGPRTYLQPEFRNLAKAFTNLASNAVSDPRAGQWTAFFRHDGTNFAATNLWYSNATNIDDTNIFAEFNALHPIGSDTRVRNLVRFVREIQESNPYGLREAYATLTTKASVELAVFAIDHFYNTIQSISNIKGANPVLLFQSITVPQMENMAQNGGDPLGLDPDNGPLYLIAIETWWENTADDAAVHQCISDILRGISNQAREMNLQQDYLYMNYASKFQDVIRGYGVKNKQRLSEIAQRYDPDGVFQRLQPGHFKLNGPAVPSKLFSGSWE